MKKGCLGVLAFFLTFSLIAQEHAQNTEADGRSKNDVKRNDKYLALCNGNSKAPSGSVVTSKLDAKTLAAYDLLRAKCANCHNPGSTSGGKNFSDILNVQELISKGLVNAKNVDGSTLIARVEDESMPLEGTELSDDERKTLKAWITDGAKSFNANSSEIPEVGFVSNDDLEACMVKDLRNVDEENRPFTRYLNLGNLYNSGRRGELERTRLALNKLLNSLSWKEKIKNPVVVDGTGTLLRFDLRDYKWTPEMWEEIAKTNPYPEPIDTAKERELVEKTGTRTPHLRGDWVVFTASKPPLYHTLLYDQPKLAVSVGKTNADSSLEKLLSVDAKENEKNGDLTKAGFKQSNVTKSNRTVERHDTPFGAYWKSDDFKTRVGDQNIFEYPLDYKKDGGEFIYNLPNKLHGYLVTNAKGDRLDGAPTDVAVDRLRFHKDGVVITGVSCMSCHTKGIKKHDDEVLPHFQSLEPLLAKNPNPTLQDLIKNVKRVYKNNTVLNNHYKDDEKVYAEAVKKTGSSVENPDPVFATSNQFDAPLDVRSIAAELGHEPKEVEELLNNNVDLKQRLAFGSQHTVDRDTFNANFSLLRNLLDGKAGGVGVPGTIASDPGIDANFEFAAIKPGTFKMGSPSTEKDRDGDETQHSVTISKPFEIQTTEVTQSLYEKVTGKTPSNFKGANRPVEQVSWNDAQEFIKKLNERPEVKRSGFKYRLPTEAEWEYAARGGNSIPEKDMQTAYSFGDDPNQLGNFGWFTGKSAVNGIRQTHDVKDASKKANPLKLNDMHGNVWEWVEDAYQANLGAGAVTDPRIDSGSVRVIRGGGWNSGARNLRSANRGGDSAGLRDLNVGFRLVRTPQ